MIDKKNFWSIVCTVFTWLLIGKIILESIQGKRDVYYVENILCIFGITVVATFLLSLHKYLQNVPVLLVMVIQYAALIGSVMGAIWIGSHFVEMHPDMYRDMFLSVTIPYVILAGIYYVSFFMEVKRANALLANINQGERE